MKQLSFARTFLCLWLTILVSIPVAHAQDQSVTKTITTIAEALALALSADATEPLPETVRLQRFTGTYIGDTRRWDLELRDGDTVHRVRVDSNASTKSSKRYDERGADPAFWSQIPPARDLNGLDALVTDANRIVSEAGFTPAGPMLVKYSIAGPRAGKNAQQEKLEVFFEIEDGEMARRVVFIDGQFDQLTRARLLKIQLPQVRAPQITPPSIQPPKIRPPIIQAPAIQLPEITATGITVQENDEMAVITVSADILFDFDKADIRPDAEAALQQITTVLQNRYADHAFTIHGHTDAKGSEDYNLKLSEQRANSVTAWLTRQGVTAQRSSIEAHGETNPVAPNNKADGSDNPEGRQLNRRVEIIVQKS